MSDLVGGIDCFLFVVLREGFSIHVYFVFYLYVLMRINVLVASDPVEDVVSFIRSYEERYGNIHPVFYQGSYSQALSDAKQELRFLLVYLHKDEAQEVDQWCR